MTQKIWYEVWGKGPMTMKLDLLAKVRSPGLANLIARLLADFYEDIEIR